MWRTPERIIKSLNSTSTVSIFFNKGVVGLNIATVNIMVSLTVNKETSAAGPENLVKMKAN